MRRRGFINVVGGSVIAWPLSARAQQPAGRMSHIAYLGASSPTRLDPRAMKQFKTGLAENGLVEGRNITVDYFWGEGKRERLQQLAAELAQRDLDVIVTAGPQPLRALIEARTKSPIVFAILNDPISDGFIQNLAHPGGNITGLSMAGTDLESKRLEMLKDAVPALKKVMILQPRQRGHRMSSLHDRFGSFRDRLTLGRAQQVSGGAPITGYRHGSNVPTPDTPHQATSAKLGSLAIRSWVG